MDRAALFDVDGTLADTNYLHVTAWFEALRQAGHTVSMHAVHRALGLPAAELVGQVLGGRRGPDENGQITAAHDAFYGTWFDRLPALQSAGDLLRRLDRRGWRVVLVTSASAAELAVLRAAIDAEDVIAASVSGEDVREGKPGPEPLHRALELVGVEPRRAVFVGDTVWDMEAGCRAGVTCVGLLSGGIPREDLAQAGAAAVYAHPAELLAQLDGSPFAEGAEPSAP
ncbi:HAD family hydrolase [Streptomyces bambusae]|uniref:HAD-IA family hydrolase n=1 Tax=Streptomyces bambusae TaxID=1550616 RepID=A0ABS6ZGS4_9ACTN|nr:HAD family hydrolase [Streptomyces bambusae]MBW5486639.1 HAD-IA family hydrolase [Streptomyces bambusae]